MTVRLSLREAADIEATALACGMSMGEFLRLCALCWREAATKLAGVQPAELMRRAREMTPGASDA